MTALVVALFVGGIILSRQPFKTLRSAAQNNQALSRLFRALQPETGTSVESAVHFSQSTLSDDPSADVNAFKLLHVNETLKLWSPKHGRHSSKMDLQLESRLKVGLDWP